jgi:hypothetical protein
MTVVINGTTGITNDGGYTGDGVVFADTTPANTLVTTTGGNVGIGTSSPSYKLDTQTSGAAVFNFQTSAANGGYGVWYAGTTTTYIGSLKAILATGSASDFAIIGTGANNLVLGTNSSERARIDSSGNLLVGTTTFPTSGVSTSGLGLFTEGGGGAGRIQSGKTASGTFTSIANYHAGTYVGGINYSNTATSLVASSDERLKDNIVSAPAALEKAMSIEVVSYDWKHDPTHVEFGLVAQRLYSIYPEAVNVGDDGEEVEKTWGVEYGRLTPILLKAIQEQQAIIEQLRSDVEALKAAA